MGLKSRHLVHSAFHPTKTGRCKPKKEAVFLQTISGTKVRRAEASFILIITLTGRGGTIDKGSSPFLLVQKLLNKSKIHASRYTHRNEGNRGKASVIHYTQRSGFISSIMCNTSKQPDLMHHLVFHSHFLF